MRVTSKVLLVTAAIALPASPLAAADGILIVQKTTSAGGTASHQIAIEKTRMRAEAPGRGPEKQSFVFDGTKQVMWLVNDEKKTYSEITKEDVDRLGSQAADAMTQVQQQMQSLPPEQRARIEAMMRGRGLPGAAAPARIEYRKTGTDKVGAWTCDKYDGYRGDQKISEVCTVDPKTLGFALEDFEVSRQLAAFFAKLVPQGADSVFRIGRGEDGGFSGVPVRQVTIGPPQSSWEITELKRQAFPDSTFAVPSGYTKEASPFAGRGRGRQ